MRDFILIVLLFLPVPVFAQPQTSLGRISQSNIGRQTDASIGLVRLKSDQPIPAAVREAAKSVCRVNIRGRDGGGYAGSGTYIGERTIVTARHVVAEGVLTTTTVDFAGQVFSGRGFLANKTADQYLIQIAETPNVRPIPLASRQPEPGEVVFVMGFGHNKFDIWSARLTSYGSAVSQQDSGFYTGRRSRSGDSGGAVLNAAGEYVGTIWGGGKNDAVAVTYTQTRSFFQRSGLLGRLFGRRGTPVTEEQTITAGCFGGQCTPRPRQPSPQPSPQPSTNDQGYVPGPDYFGQPPSNPPVDAPAPSLDVDGLVDAIADRIGTPKCECDCESKPGAPGPVGPKGDAGPRGPPGDSASITQEQLEQVAVMVLRQMPKPSPQRVMLVNGATGKVLDDETYQDGEPIVIDFQRVINAATK